MGKYHRYLIGIAGFGVTLALGTLYAWGVFVPTLEEYFGVTRAEVMIPFSIASVVFALGMVPAGRLQDKKGPKLIVIIGGISAGLGYALSSTAVHLWQLSLYFGLLGGMGMALGYCGAVAGGVKWFPDSKGTATGIMVGGFGLGALVFGPVIHILLERVGWESTFLILGIIFAIIIISLGLLVIKNPPAGWMPEGWDPAKLTRTKTVEYTGMEVTGGKIIKTPEFIGMWIFFFSICSGGLAIMTQMVPFSRDYFGFTAAAATGLVMIFSILNFSGRLGLGPLSDRIGRLDTFMLIGVLMTIAVFLFAIIYFLNMPFLFYILVPLAGISFGGCLALSPAFAADVWGLKNFGLNYGMLFTAWGIAGIYGPYFAGAVYDALGSYEVAFLVFTIQCVISVLLARYYVKPRLQSRIQQLQQR